MASLASPIRIGDRRAKALPASPTRVGLRVRKPAFGTELCAHHAAFPQRKPGFPNALDPRDDLYAGNSRTLGCWADSTRSGTNNSAGNGRIWCNSRYWASRELECTDPQGATESCRQQSAFAALEQMQRREAREIGAFLPRDAMAGGDARAPAFMQPASSVLAQQQQQQQRQSVLPEWALELKRTAEHAAAERAAQEAARARDEAEDQRRDYAAWKAAREAARLDELLRAADLSGRLMRDINETREGAQRAAKMREERARAREKRQADAALHARVLRELADTSGQQQQQQQQQQQEFVTMDAGVSIRTEPIQARSPSPVPSPEASAPRSSPVHRIGPWGAR